jgi:7,8-dihydropterin-6-yl-methyl-4-(beta-D-ribofuranosyl)aminobenzene 5'-phosphate synthase
LEFEPDVVVPMHCSGEDFVEIMHEVAPDRMLLAASGSQLIFGA